MLKHNNSRCKHVIPKGALNVAGSMTGMTLNNRYQLIERVGIGGMAEVYRAHDTVLGPRSCREGHAAAIRS